MTRTTKRTSALLALMLALILVSAGTSALAATLEEGAKLPAFELPAGDGKTYTFDTLRGDGGLVLIVYRGVW